MAASTPLRERSARASGGLLDSAPPEFVTRSSWTAIRNGSPPAFRLGFPCALFSDELEKVLPDVRCLDPRPGGRPRPRCRRSRNERTPEVSTRDPQTGGTRNVIHMVADGTSMGHAVPGQPFFRATPRTSVDVVPPLPESGGANRLHGHALPELAGDGLLSGVLQLGQRGSDSQWQGEPDQQGRPR